MLAQPMYRTVAILKQKSVRASHPDVFSVPYMMKVAEAGDLKYGDVKLRACPSGASSVSTTWQAGSVLVHAFPVAT